MAVTRKISTMIRSIVFFLLLGHVLSFFPFTKTTESNVETVLTGVRGVPEYLQSKYEKETFTCDGGTKTYSKDEINDSFCDCADGSDEPGTSACAGNIFSCANKGYRIIQIPSSRVDDGVCDCCDGSDEGTVVKCGNQCAAAAVKEKELIEKVTVAYKIGSVIRAADVLRIEKSKEDLLLEVEPLRTSADEKKRAVDNLREIMSVADKLHSEENSRAHEEVSNSVKKLMGFPTISEYEIGGILSNLFSLLELNSADVKAAVLDAGIIPFDPSTTPSQSAQQSTRQSREDRFDRGDDDDDEENEHENEADGAFPVDDEKELEVEIEAEVAEVVPITTIEPFHCTLFHYVADTHLKYLCNYKIQGSEENPISQSEEETAATAHIMDNAKSLLLSMLKSRDIYTEVQLLQGYYRMKKSYEGASEFIQSHKELLDPRSCPSAWADSPDVNDLCSLGDTLGKLYNTLKRLSTKDTEPESNVAIAEQELRDAEDKLSITEKDLKEMDDYSEFFEYLALKNKCFDGLDGKFTYNVCILGQLTQRDGDNDSSEVTLGTFSSIDNNPDTGGIIMHFTEGTHCWAFGPRTADVFITCGPEQKMISSNEPTTCYYTFEVESPSGCTENFARINGIL